MRLTYLGTAMMRLELDGLRLVTDPVLDPAGARYDMGPWYAPRAWFSSEKTYETPRVIDGAPAFEAVDAVLLSHDHHADNLDAAGRALIAAPEIGRVVTTTAGARRLARAAKPDAEGHTAPGAGLGLGERVTGLAWGATTTLGGLRVTATPARHGPRGTPRVHEVNGFLLEPARADEPVVWISGDTVLWPALRKSLAAMAARPGGVDVAVVHCGGVRFPQVPLLGKALFTFDVAQAVEACRILAPRLIVPIHREGWLHFRESTAALRAGLDAAGLGERVRWLELGETLTVAGRGG